MDSATGPAPSSADPSSADPSPASPSPAGPSSAQLAEEVRAALGDITDPVARSALLAGLAVLKELQALTRSSQSVDTRLKRLNQYLGAIANKP
ncbi:hypothetical protein ACFWCB_19560 [Streptomyces sp. NPDC060048]|uniref:hypothetical protein n=1 Tax=unclassified Streptomyces TaxID=2593676 RepID=UPI0036870A8D